MITSHYRPVMFRALVGCVLVLSGECASGGDAMLDSSSVRSQYFAEGHLRHKFVEAGSGVAKGHIARELFRAASPEALQILRCDEDDGLALTAAWHRLELQMKARLVSVEGSATEVQIPSALTREFLGFVEGRLGVPAPGRWSDVVREAVFHRSGSPRFPMILTTHRDPGAASGYTDDPFGEFDRRKWTAPYLTLDLEPPPTLIFRGGFVFEGEDENVVLPERLRVLIPDPTSDKVLPRFSGIATGDRAIVVIEDMPEPMGGEVVCIDTERGRKPEVLWSAPLDARWSDVWEGSEWFTELRAKAGKVILFHGTHDGIGIEAFRIADGKRLFSFNSDLPDAPGETTLR